MLAHVGHVAVQVAKNLGAKVTAIASSRNEIFVRRLGADFVACYDQEDLETKISQSQIVRGKFHIIFDTVTSDNPRDKAHNYHSRLTPFLDPSGIYITIGGGGWDWTCAHLKRFLGLNLFPKNRILHWVRFSHATEYLERLAKWIDQGKLDVNVGNVYEFSESDLEKAFMAQLTRRTVGKIVIKIE